MIHMSVEDIQDKIYAGYGRCIYCDSTTKCLTDEHIMPYSLQGNTYIKDACCEPCRKKIDPIDRHLGRSVFGQYRVHADIQTRNPKERPKTLPARFTVRSETVLMDLPIADHPYTLAMPIWGDPGFFRAALIDAPFPQAFYHLYQYSPPNLRETLGVEDDESFQI
jgi:hypothetical protein